MPVPVATTLNGVAVRPAQTADGLVGCVVIVVFGFTTTVYVDSVPVQPFAVGVTVIVAVIGAVVAFVAVNDGTFPVPFAAKPIAVLLLPQAYVVPDTGPDKVVSEAVDDAQWV